VIFLEKTLWEGDSPYNGRVKVIEGSGMRRLVVGGYTQSRTLGKDGKTSFYWDIFAENLPPFSTGPKILILGLAAGTTAKIFTNKFGNIIIHGVEQDPLIVELGKKYFDLSQPNLEIFIENAEKFVASAQDKYDVVCLDVFRADATPPFLLEREFLNNLKNLLAKNGLVIANKICHNEGEDKEFVEGIKKIFPHVSVVRQRGNKYQQNVIIYAKD